MQYQSYFMCIRPILSPKTIRDTLPILTRYLFIILRYFLQFPNQCPNIAVKTTYDPSVIHNSIIIPIDNPIAFTLDHPDKLLKYYIFVHTGSPNSVLMAIFALLASNHSSMFSSGSLRDSFTSSNSAS